jgi:hypothetical protein
MKHLKGHSLRNWFEEEQETTNTYVYNQVREFKRKSCPVCPPNKGCNGAWRIKKNKSWKQYRKTQYK